MGLRSLQRHLRPRGISGDPCSRPRARKPRLLPIGISPSYLEQMMPLLLRHHQLVAVRHHGVHVHQPIPELLVLRLKLLQAGKQRRPSSVTARTERPLVLPGAPSPVGQFHFADCVGSISGDTPAGLDGLQRWPLGSSWLEPRSRFFMAASLMFG